MIETAQIASKWYRLGWALKISITELERLDDKYYDRPEKALTRMYCHWLVVNEDISKPEIELIKALKKVDEHTLAVAIEKKLVSWLACILLHVS